MNLHGRGGEDGAVEDVSQEPVFCRFYLYQTTQRVYLVASDKSGEHWRLLKFDKTAAMGELEVTEDPHHYSKAQCSSLLKTVHEGNLQHGGLQLVCQGYGVIGCFKFLEGYYLCLVTKKRFQGTLCGHKVYGIESTALVPLVGSVAHKAFVRSNREAAAAESKYLKLLAGVSLSSDFFFSYSLQLWRTLQQAQGPGGGGASSGSSNAAGGGTAGGGSPGAVGRGGGCGGSPFDSDRVWNAWLTRPLREALGNDKWVLPLVHGFWEQRRLALFGRTLTLTVIARRSRQFAGTRYRKRGVSDAGYVANDVETEQVVEAGPDWRTGQPLVSSMVQVRGSIPLYWAQSSDAGRLKPQITLQRFDPLYAATRKHFDDLRRRYGNPIVVLNLVKMQERHPRESLLGRELEMAVAHLNRQTPPAERVQYVAWDLSRHAKTDSRHLLQDLQRLQAPMLRATGLYVRGGSSAGGAGCSYQHGVLRTNCVDCLDRTNVAQFSAGLLALGIQLHALGISEGPRLDPESSLARQLLDMYEQCGHALSLQYGGSEAHTAFFQRQRGDWEAATQSRDVLTSIRRFYSNAYTDAEKQDAINLFLGNFQPQRGKPHLWELGGDYYLHHGRGMASLARQLFLGPGSHAAPSSSSQPASREGSHRGGASTGPGSAAAAAAAATAMAAGPSSPSSQTGGMVSLRAPGSAPSPAVSVGPASPRNLASPGAAESGSESGLDKPGRPPAVRLGVGLGTGRPPLAAPVMLPHLSVSTDGVEVPTLAQLVEGASPSWRPSAAEDAALEALILDGGSSATGEGQGQGQGGVQQQQEELFGAAAEQEAAVPAAAAAAEGCGMQGLGEGAGQNFAEVAGGEQGAAAEEGATAPDGAAPLAGFEAEQQQQQEQQEQQAQAAAGAQQPGVAGLPAASAAGAPALPAAPGEQAASPPAAPAAVEPAGAASGIARTQVAIELASAAPQPAAACSSRAAAAPAPSPRVPAGRGRQPPPPPSARRSKLESFDKLISKPPNAVRQVRLTATPAAPARSASLTSWLPSPTRAKQPSQSPRPPAPAASTTTPRAAGTGSVGAGGVTAAAAAPGTPRVPAPAGPPPALSRLSPGITAELQLGASAPAGQRLYRSSSDSTLMASLSEAAGWVASRQQGGTDDSHYSPPAPGQQAGAQLPRRVSFDWGAVGAAAADVALAAGLPHSSSSGAMGASSVSEYMAPGTWGRTQVAAPTGYLVVLDAWDSDAALGAASGASGGGQPRADGGASGAASPQPRSADGAAGSGKPPRSRSRSRFPGFPFRSFGRSKSTQGFPTAPASEPALSPTRPSPSPRSSAGFSGATTPPPAATSSGAALGWEMPALYSPASGSLYGAVPGVPGGRLGSGTEELPPRTAAALWAGGADPVALMLAEEQRLREHYTRQLRAMATAPSPSEQHAMAQQMAALTRPTWSLTLSGQMGQGAALQWRQQAGLMGAPTLGQQQLATLAQHAAAAQQAQQQAAGPQQVQHAVAF